MMKKENNQILSIEITGLDLEEMLEQFLREKLGNVEINYLELVKSKIKNKHILNDNDNEFYIFVEYNRGGK